MAALAEVPRELIGPRMIGVHLEGPFLSPLRLGAHPVSSRRDPDPALLERLLAAGPVSEMTLAPELDGALDLIDVLNAHGVVASCGHSDATAEQAALAFDRGVATVTHLFNAMRPLGHRDPGIAGAALARDDVVVQVILDGQHLADETAQGRLARRRGPSRARLRCDRCRGHGRRQLPPRRRRGRRAQRRRASGRRRARGQLADADRSGAAPACTRRPACRCRRRGDSRSRTRRPPARARLADARAPTRTSSSSTTRSRSARSSSAARSWSRYEGATWPRS